MTRKESIPSIDCNGSNGALDRIIVDLNSAILQEQAEALPVFGDVFEGFSERGLRRDAGAGVGQPSLKPIYNRLSLFLSNSKPSLGVLSTDGLLDLV